VSLPAGLALGGLALLLGGPLLRLRARYDRLLLGPTRASALTLRVQRLTQTRAEAVDDQAAQLRRIERDLHDGAQARLVAVGLSLATVEQLWETDPEAARRLLARARDTSGEALSDLRNLVRGIHPPVLAERGLADAVRAVALDAPLPVRVNVNLPGRFDTPVETAAYFATAEALTNATRHAQANSVDIDISYADRVLRIRVRDDGQGGANPIRGTGLSGIRRRLGAFDGDLRIDSPVGGPTIVTMEIPRGLLSPKTSSGTD
jgi:signal transduction histidine kinase